jgi:hypothetical protein
VASSGVGGDAAVTSGAGAAAADATGAIDDGTGCSCTLPANDNTQTGFAWLFCLGLWLTRIRRPFPAVC